MAHKAWKVLTIWPLPEKVCQPRLFKSWFSDMQLYQQLSLGFCVKRQKGQRLFILKPLLQEQPHSFIFPFKKLCCVSTEHQAFRDVRHCWMLLEALPIFGSRGHLANGIRAVLHNTYSHLLPKSLPLHTCPINPPCCLRATQFHTPRQTSLASSQQTHTLWSPDVKPWEKWVTWCFKDTSTQALPKTY